MNKQERLKLNQQGYNDYIQLIEEKEKELADIRMYKGKDAIYQGDNWHDNPTLYQTELKELSLMKEIKELKNKLQYIDIVENVGDDTLVDIGDIVEFEAIFDEDDIEVETVRIVGTNPNVFADISEVSINSPLGAAIYHKKVGDYVSYNVDDRVFKIRISKKNPLANEDDFSLKKEHK